jgi:folate-binding protein YgfZ
MKAAFLPDRGVVKVSGEDARDFLNGLVTTDVTLLQPGLGRFGALLTPQGKITIDFLITEAPAGHGGGFLIDVPLPLAQSLADKLGFYKLRAKVTVENISESIGVLAVWDGEPAVKPDLAFADPRHEALGWRILAPEDLSQKVAELIGADLVESEAYEAHRIANGVPRGGLDFMYSDAFPHEANMDRLHGVDFDKGCYVGQEITARTKYRGLGKRRLVSVFADSDLPPPGTPILQVGAEAGTLRTTLGGAGLALLRLDALEKADPLVAGGISLRLEKPTQR